MQSDVVNTTELGEHRARAVHARDGVKACGMLTCGC